LWITSNPFKAGEMSFGGISKRPWKQSDTEIAREVVTAAAPLWCESQKTTQIPQSPDRPRSCRPPSPESP
jgi:hypothetical protein